MTPTAALQLLASLGAPPWLIRHHELVLEAAELLCGGIAGEIGIELDRERVLAGAALHDAGKIEHPAEMREPGHAHESAGRALLLRAGVSADVSRFCTTHAAWDAPDSTIEDLLVALADKLWKGKRDQALEERVAEACARLTGRERWAVFAKLDEICESIAANGPDRLSRSNV